jgi:hypothetical protein
MAFKKGDMNINRAGRPKGSANEVTKELKEFFETFLINNKGKFEGLFDEIAASQDPAKAFELYLKVAGYVIPKPTNKEGQKAPEQSTIIVLPEKDIIQKI